VALLAVIALGASWWLGWRPGSAVVVRTTVVTARSASAAGATVLNASGYVTARRRATVSSKITGKLVEVNIEEGQSVAEGDVIARLDDAQFQASLELARSRLEAARRAVDETTARLELAELTLARTERLVAGGVADRATLDQNVTERDALRARLELDRQQVQVAEREVALRRAELADTVITAPFSGVVISKDAQSGEMVSPVSAGGGFTRTGVCTIVDMGSLEIEVDVNESYISRVRPGQEVEAVLDAYPDWRIPAHVITTVPAADRQKATVLVRIGFDGLDPRLLPEMGVSVAFRESGSVDGEKPAGGRPTVSLPKTALRTIDGRDVVFVVDSGRVERRAVGVGRVSGDSVEILSGLGAGEKVVVEGGANLQDGDAVEERAE
jgi:RND family efflux transporter MFP subunit